MKNKIISFIFSIFTLITLVACSSKVENVRKDIEDAIQKNNTLENATFEWSLTMQPGDIDQLAEGVFITKDKGDYDWSYTEYLGEGQNFSQSAEINGRQYELLWVDEPGFEAEWKQPEGEILNAIELLEPLFEQTIEDKYIGEVEVTEEDGMHYRMTLNEIYLEEEFSESHSHLEISKPTIDMTINGDGYLTKYIFSYTFSAPEEESVETTVSYELTDYNIDNAESLLPEIR